MSVTMKCGHTAQGTTQEGTPVCVVCWGITPGADEIAQTQPNVEGRTMRCSYARAGTETHGGGGQYAGTTRPSTQPSNPSAAFFASHPDADEDEYYCGCFGWD